MGRRLWWLTLWEAALRVALVVVVLMAVLMTIDWWFELPRVARAAGGALVLAAAGWVAWRFGVLPIVRLPRKDALALWVERQQPQLRSRLISGLQLARQAWETPEATAFVGRLVSDAGEAVALLQPRLLVPAEGLRRCAWRVLPVLVGLGLGFAWNWPLSGILLRRALLEEVPVPRKTRLVEVTGAQTVGRGDDLTIRAVAEGVLPRSGTLLVRHESGRVQRLDVEPDSDRRGAYVRVLANLPTSFQYRVRINDALSDEFPVTVLPRPIVTNLLMTLTPPPYSGLPPRTLQPGELTLLRGSTLRIEGAASQALQAATVTLGGVDQERPAALDAADPTRFLLEVPADDPRWNGFSVKLVDQNGIGSVDPAVYAVQVVPDRPPRVRIQSPARREELVTIQGTVLVAFEATDDLGIASLFLRYQPAGTTNAVTPTGRELDRGSEGRPTSVQGRLEWSMASLRPRLAEGDLVEFWIEARDANDQEGKGLGSSDRYLLRVVSEAEKRADLLTRAGDAIGRLGDVAEGQDRLNERLGRIIVDQAPER